MFRCFSLEHLREFTLLHVALVTIDSHIVFRSDHTRGKGVNYRLNSVLDILLHVGIPVFFLEFHEVETEVLPVWTYTFLGRNAYFPTHVSSAALERVCTDAARSDEFGDFFGSDPLPALAEGAAQTAWFAPEKVEDIAWNRILRNVELALRVEVRIPTAGLGGSLRILVGRLDHWTGPPRLCI